jgi:hypothetical protein
MRPAQGLEQPGAGKPVCLSILRQAVEPLTTGDTAMERLVSRALNKDDVKLFKLIVKRANVALRAQRYMGWFGRERATAICTLGGGQVGEDDLFPFCSSVKKRHPNPLGWALV